MSENKNILFLQESVPALLAFWKRKKKQIPCSRLKGEKPKEIRKKIRKLLLMARFNSYLKVGERAVTYTFIFKLIQER